MLYVEEMRDIDAATWDRLLLHSPGGGHAVQTHAWGEFKATQGWRPQRLALKDGATVLGVAQVLLRRVPGATGALAYCAKGPWIDWSSAEQTRVMLEGMRHFARRRGAFVFKVESELPSGPGQPTQVPASIERPLRGAIAGARRLRSRGDIHTAPSGGPEANKSVDEDDRRVGEARAAIGAARQAQAADGHGPGRRVFTELGFVKSRWDLQNRTTMVIDLDRPPEAMLARMKSKWRYNVNLARRKGLTVVEDNSVAARRILYEMHVHTSERDGFMPRPRAYCDGAWSAMIDAGYAHLFLACYEGRPLAALLAFTFGHKVWYQVGASETEGRNLMPAHALQFHVMAWAQQRGLTYYDLVAIPNAAGMSTRDPMWGLYVFKSGFGGRPVEWAGCLDSVLDARGHLWQAIEPAYYRLYRWRRHDIFY